jgi:hypothetical protein
MRPRPGAGVALIAECREVPVSGPGRCPRAPCLQAELSCVKAAPAPLRRAAAPVLGLRHPRVPCARHAIGDAKGDVIRDAMLSRR